VKIMILMREKKKRERKMLEHFSTSTKLNLRLNPAYILHN
jgi:hypothetical protein